ncbi:hypothetical protein IG631_16762 [Alternaria alternata]|nr:hypothetical protein IG631_16762 [Alternaria alternata]
MSTFTVCAVYVGFTWRARDIIINNNNNDNNTSRETQGRETSVLFLSSQTPFPSFPCQLLSSTPRVVSVYSHPSRPTNDLAVVADLAAKRLVDTVTLAQPDELNSPVVNAVEQGFGLSVGVGGLASGIEGLVDG